MSFVAVKTDKNTPPEVSRLVAEQIAMQFGDVHTMLRLPMREPVLEAGCNFATANCLLALISGFASLLTPRFDTTRMGRDKFAEVMKNYYPWDVQPAQGDTTPHGTDGTISHLYDYFRNPLAHSLGIKTKGNYLVRVGKSPLSEAEIEKLERSVVPLGPAIIYGPIRIKGEDIEEIKLNVGNLYWGVREMFYRMTRDKQLMQDVGSNLKREGF